jgi:hypothetical protein
VAFWQRAGIIREHSPGDNLDKPLRRHTSRGFLKMRAVATQRAEWFFRFFVPGSADRRI